MGNLICAGNCCCGDEEENNGQQRNGEQRNGQQRNLQVSRYAALLGPMLGGSFPASVAVYNLIKSSSDIVKLGVFGTVTFAVFAIASGLAATSLGTTARTVLYARVATFAAVTIVLSLFTAALCTLFTSQWYQLGCGLVGGALILVLVFFWWILKW